MANYSAYIPAAGSTTYPTQISNFITISEGMDTEIENGRDGLANLLANFNTKLPLAGGTLTGALTISTGSLTISTGGILIGASSVPVKDGALSNGVVVTGDASGRVSTTSGIVAANIATLSGTNVFSSIPAFNGGQTGSSAPFTVDSTDVVINLNADLLDSLNSTQFLRSDDVDTCSGKISFTGGIDISGGANNALFFESGKHVITTNDGGSNFNIRIGHTFTANSTEAGYASHWGFSQNTGAWSFNTSTASLDGLGQVPTWNTLLSFSNSAFTYDGFEVWHAGNDGTGSLLDADKLDGAEGALYARLASPTFSGTPSLPTGTTGVTQASTNSSTKLATTAFRHVGSIVQSVITEDGEVATGTTLLPSDNSIPQITEGNEFITVTITPESAANKLIIEGLFMATNPAIGIESAALFQDSIANALAVVSHYSYGNGGITHSIKYEMAAGTTSAITFRIRIGNKNAGTMTFNGLNSARSMGGVMASFLKVTEVSA